MFMGKNDLTRLCVHLCVLFLKKNRKKKSVHFQKIIITRIRVDEDLACRAKRAWL